MFIFPNVKYLSQDPTRENLWALRYFPQSIFHVFQLLEVVSQALQSEPW